MTSPTDKNPTTPKKIIGWAALGTGVLVGLFAIPKSVFNFKPISRFEEKLNLLADSKTGDLFSWLEAKDGGRYLVKLDKTPEHQVRGKQSPATYEPPKATNQKPVQSDVRSGRVFTETGTKELGNIKYNFTASIKYRGLENSMLYRVSISPIKISGEPCVTEQQWKTLQGFIGKQTAKNSLKLRFEDSDKFWIQDLKIPLVVTKADNKTTTVIDSKRDECGKLSELIYHGRATLRLPTFSWVDNGKLLFKGLNANVSLPKPAAPKNNQKEV